MTDADSGATDADAAPTDATDPNADATGPAGDAADPDADAADPDADADGFDASTALAGARGKLALAAVFLVAIVAAELTDATAPAIGLETAFDVQAAIVGTFIVLFGGAQFSHATDVAGSAEDGTASQLQRGGAVIVLGGFVVLAVAFL